MTFLELVLEGLIRAGVSAAEVAAAAKNIERKLRLETKSGEEKKFDYQDVFSRFDGYYEKFRQEQDKKDSEQRRYRQQQAGGAATAPGNKTTQYYAALEVKPGATFDEIKSSYKRMAKKYHPDKYAGDPAKTATAQKVMQKINEAYAYFEKREHGLRNKTI